MSPATVVLAAQAAASGMMCGIIWFVQIVHYPLFAAVPGAHGTGYAERNRRRTAWVVLPPMIVEAVAAAWLVVWPPPAIGRPLAVAGLGVAAFLWLSTLVVQMPLHQRLSQEGSTPEVVTRLVRGNWLRTILWTVRGFLAVWMLAVGAR